MFKLLIKNKGFSIVEIMIALAIGLILTGFILSIFVNNKKSYDTNNRVIEVNSNIRFALSLIQSDLDNAGFYGGLNSKDTISATANFNNTTCSYSAGPVVQFSTATNMPVFGRQATADPEAGCLSGITAGTDYLSIRGVRGFMTADSALDPNRVYVRAGKTVGEFIASGLGSSIPDSLNMNWKYYSSIYYICQNRLLRNDLIYNPTSNTSQWNTEVLVGPDLDGVCDSGDAHTEAGIENMQILYGIDNAQDGVVDYYTDGSNITTQADWGKVIEVKVSLLARSEIDNNYEDKNSSGTQRSYLLGEQTITPSSLNYHRSHITSTSFIHNIWYGVVNDPSKL
jgi:type IV pilus assembly protein PilW